MKYFRMNLFAKRLRELRLQKKLTVEQLAKETRLSSGSISSWENNKTEPLASVIVTLSKFFNVSADYLLGVEDY